MKAAAILRRLETIVGRYPARTIALALTLLAMGLWMREAMRWEDRFTIEDSFEPDDPIRRQMEIAEGRPHPEGGLVLEPGETARRIYSISRKPTDRLFVAIESSGAPEIQVRASLKFRSEDTGLRPDWFDGRLIEITSLTHEGESRFEIQLTSHAAAGSRPVVALRSVSFERRGAKTTLHWGSFLFFAAGAAFFWIFLVIFLVPALACAVLKDRPSAAQRPLWALGAAALLAAYGWLCFDPGWNAKKDYDDRTAISNAALLLDEGYNPSALYFRSRVRPGFLAIVQPLLVLSPHRFQSYWLNPSDAFRRDWFVYDQDNWSFGGFTYPLLSLFSQALALVLIAMMYAIYRALGVDRPWAWLATVAAVFFFRGALAIHVTQTVNLFVNVAAIWAFLGWGRSDSSAKRASAGLVLGFALLVKETALTSVLAIALFIAVDGPRGGLGARARRSIAFWAGAALAPLAYFALISEGGFAELTSNFDEHLDQQILNRFEPLTPATALRDLWKVFGWGLPLAAISMIWAARGRFKAPGERLALCWTLGCLPVFTLPYIFPRFLQYLIPAIALWVALMAANAFKGLAYIRQRQVS